MVRGGCPNAPPHLLSSHSPLPPALNHGSWTVTDRPSRLVIRTVPGHAWFFGQRHEAIFIGRVACRRRIIETNLPFRTMPELSLVRFGMISHVYDQSHDPCRCRPCKIHDNSGQPSKTVEVFLEIPRDRAPPPRAECGRENTTRDRGHAR